MLTLNITLDKNSLSTLGDAGYRIVLLADTRPLPLIVACLLDPMEQQSVHWTDAESVYASTTTLKQGATIEINSTQSASAGGEYDYDSGQITAGSNGNDPSRIQLENSSGDTITGGLGSAFTTAHNSAPDTVPVVGTSILGNARATFPARNDYLISAMSGAATGMVVSESVFEGSKSLSVPLSALPLTPLPFASTAADCLNVTFNSTTNQFEAPTQC